MEALVVSVPALMGWLLLALVAFFALMFLLDADLSLTFCEYFFSSKLGDFGGKVVWVTGASSGIGEALAVEAASLGARVVITARSEDKLHGVKEKCLAAGRKHGLSGEDVLVLPLDLCAFDRHQETVDRVMEHFKKVDTVFLNAGRSQRARWEHTELGVDRDLFDLNVFSTVSLARLLVPHFERRGRGDFGVVTSVAAKVAPPFSGTYCGSKFAVHGYFECLRSEKLGSGINITMLCPGPTFSNLLPVAATEKTGQSYEGHHSSSDRRMTAERCARLSLLAVANGLEEAWISVPPVLPLMYPTVYAPSVSKRLLKLLGKSYLQKLRDGRDTVKQE